MATPTQEQMLKRIDGVLEKAEKALESRRPTSGYLNSGDLQTFRSAGLTLLGDLYGQHHVHYQDFLRLVVTTTGNGATRGRAIIKVVREEVEQGLLTTTRALIAADLFSDFLEMAGHLLDGGYKDAAAVIAGSSLEGHLRRMAIAFSTNPNKPGGEPKKADVINAELHKTDAYVLSEQKQITAWLGIRNDAAHGHYDKVLKDSVKLMIEGIRHFMTLHPA